MAILLQINCMPTLYKKKKDASGDIAKFNMVYENKS